MIVVQLSGNFSPDLRILKWLGLKKEKNYMLILCKDVF